MSEKNHGKSSDNRKKPGRSNKPYRSKRNDEGKSYGSKPHQQREDRFKRNEGERPERGSKPHRSKRDEGKSYGSKPHQQREDRFKRNEGERPERGSKPHRSKRNDEGKSYGSKPHQQREDKFKRNEGERPERGNKPYRSKRDEGKSYGSKPYQKREDRFKRNEEERPERSNKSYRSKRDDEGKSYGSKPHQQREDRFKRNEGERPEKFTRRKDSKFEEPDHVKRDALSKSHYSKKKQLAHHLKQPPIDGMVRLNKFIANAGACSRREADEYIAKGRITVNGKVVSEVGTKVKLTDDIRFDEERIATERKVYLVLNKPKDFVTTVDDPMNRKTVMGLIDKACKERVYPVGRLDRMTTGILLFTNDGELTKKLTHPKYEKKKIYHVFLNKPVVKQDIQKISEGVELEDGFVKTDDISYVDNEDKSQVGIEIHSGKNRIIRRIFEHLGYDVEKLDRVFFAGITKKNLPRGRWRFLTDKEINLLKNY